jgi:two-component sensor histidine kinase
VLAVIADISERKRTEDRQRLLIGELNHRIQNLFAVIQSVAYNSLGGERPIGEAREVFIERLHSLGRTYTIMTEQQWRGAPIRQILSAELSPFSDRVVLDGIDVMVRQSSAQSFALLFHELTTNAVKYGALSSAQGRIDVRWAVDREAQPAIFRFAWEESGGPPVLPPTRSGYGRKIIEETVRRLGKHQISYAVDGVKYRMEARLDKIGWVMEEGG